MQIEIDLNLLQKGEKRVWVKATAKRKGHYRKVKIAEKGIDKESEFLDLAIKGYTAQGGMMSSKFMFGSLERKALVDHLETAKPNAKGKMIHRGLAFSDDEWEKVWEQWTEPGNIVKMDALRSFTLDRKRAPIHGVGDVKIILSIKNKSGIDISKQSIYPEEKEVLSPIGFSWKVISSDILYGTTWEIIGEEI